MIKEENAIVMESIKTMEEVGVRLQFKGRSIRLDDEVIDEEREWKPAWCRKLRKPRGLKVTGRRNSRVIFIKSKKKSVTDG